MSIKTFFTTTVLTLLFAITSYAQEVVYDETNLAGSDTKSTPNGVVYFTCLFESNDGSTFSSKISFVDRSNDAIPRPVAGSTCSQYMAELLEAGACPPPMDSCDDCSVLFPLDCVRCNNFVIFGPAFCEP